ncbi:hypothetical protein ACRE_073310 [Hapsidospora chrysogenum ATCC 11550]|uniref:Uncharacterized protein n=1 Tax=Hapsidospora chrysogenum (strain ATCC 11550 / CBS 779.69 / DSM 880 / IAM 14645 / JCM 23072 / IMI 49137) TaxID=857340 RepID=A0A086SXW6_HAPC1|nr:hypothetical protein ACRE_073310 [Hapsidospora chrysogenum ATCC 11550]
MLRRALSMTPSQRGKNKQAREPTPDYEAIIRSIEGSKETPTMGKNKGGSSSSSSVPPSEEEYFSLPDEGSSQLPLGSQLSASDDNGTRPAAPRTPIVAEMATPRRSADYEEVDACERETTPDERFSGMSIAPAAPRKACSRTKSPPDKFGDIEVIPATPDSVLKKIAPGTRGGWEDNGNSPTKARSAAKRRGTPAEQAPVPLGESLSQATRRRQSDISSNGRPNWPECPAPAATLSAEECTFPSATPKPALAQGRGSKQPSVAPRANRYPPAKPRPRAKKRDSQKRQTRLSFTPSQPTSSADEGCQVVTASPATIRQECTPPSKDNGESKRLRIKSEPRRGLLIKEEAKRAKSTTKSQTDPVFLDLTQLPSCDESDLDSSSDDGAALPLEGPETLNNTGKQASREPEALQTSVESTTTKSISHDPGEASRNPEASEGELGVTCRDDVCCDTMSTNTIDLERPPSEGHSLQVDDSIPPKGNVNFNPHSPARTSPTSYVLQPAYGHSVPFPDYDPTGRTGRYQPHHRDKIVGLRDILKRTREDYAATRKVAARHGSDGSVPSKSGPSTPPVSTHPHGVEMMLGPEELRTPKMARSIGGDEEVHANKDGMLGNRRSAGQGHDRIAKLCNSELGISPAHGNQSAAESHSKHGAHPLESQIPLRALTPPMGQASLESEEESPPTTPQPRQAPCPEALRRSQETPPVYRTAKAMKPTIDRLKKRIQEGSEPSMHHGHNPKTVMATKAVEAELVWRGLRKPAQRDTFLRELALEYSRILAGSPVCLLSMWAKMLSDLNEECLEIRRDLLPALKEEEEIARAKDMTPFEALLAYGQDSSSDSGGSSDCSDSEGECSRGALKLEDVGDSGTSIITQPDEIQLPALKGHADRAKTNSGLMTPVTSPAGQPRGLTAAHSPAASPCTRKRRLDDNNDNDDRADEKKREPKSSRRRVDAVSRILQTTLRRKEVARGIAAGKDAASMAQDVVNFHTGGWKEKLKENAAVIQTGPNRTRKRQRRQHAWRELSEKMLGRR